MSEYDRLMAQRDDIEGRQRIRAISMLRRLADADGEFTTDKFSEAQSLNALWIAGLCEKGFTADGRNAWSINAAGKAAASPPPPREQTDVV
jgi:hypothetical protein